MFCGRISLACQADADQLLVYEQKILKAAESGHHKNMIEPLVCILKLQGQGVGMDRYLANSFLHPLLGGPQISGVSADPRYVVVARALEELTSNSNSPLHKSVVAEFSKGEWPYYKLFCETGDTQFCADFMPDLKKVNSESPLLAAGSLMRLRQAYKVLNGTQKNLIGQRIKKMYREIPVSATLTRKFIDQIHKDLFESTPEVPSLPPG
jgi:hypothetical protein